MLSEPKTLVSTLRSWDQLCTACVCTLSYVRYVVYVLFQFQLNPGVLPFFPSQFLPKDTPCDMLQPFRDPFGTADEGLTDWNPLDYSPLWAQGPQSPFGHVSDHADSQPSSVATDWSRMSAADDQHRLSADNSRRDQQTIGRFSEQVTMVFCLVTVLWWQPAGVWKNIWAIWASSDCCKWTCVMCGIVPLNAQCDKLMTVVGPPFTIHAAVAMLSWKFS